MSFCVFDCFISSPLSYSLYEVIFLLKIGALMNSSPELAFSNGLLSAGRDWLAVVSPTGSHETIRTYYTCLKKLDIFCRSFNIIFSELTPAQGADFIQMMIGDGLSPNTINKTVAALSSFYIWLSSSRRSSCGNPFWKSGLKPTSRDQKDLRVPSRGEIEIILEHSKPFDCALISVLAFCGVRVGMLPGFTVRGASFRTSSNQKSHTGMVPPAVRKAILQAKLPLTSPFSSNNAHQLLLRVRYHTESLRSRGLISHGFSAHEFRTFFALEAYRANPDVSWLKNLLGHASIAMTEDYILRLAKTFTIPSLEY